VKPIGKSIITSRVLELAPGTILHFNKPCDEPLSLHVGSCEVKSERALYDIRTFRPEIQNYRGVCGRGEVLGMCRSPVILWPTGIGPPD
jgi:hypothetical protein